MDKELLPSTLKHTLKEIENIERIVEEHRGLTQTYWKEHADLVLLSLEHDLNQFSIFGLRAEFVAIDPTYSQPRYEGFKDADDVIDTWKHYFFGAGFYRRAFEWRNSTTAASIVIHGYQCRDEDGVSEVRRACRPSSSQVQRAVIQEIMDGLLSDPIERATYAWEQYATWRKLTSPFLQPLVKHGFGSMLWFGKERIQSISERLLNPRVLQVVKNFGGKSSLDLGKEYVKREGLMIGPYGCPIPTGILRIDITPAELLADIAITEESITQLERIADYVAVVQRPENATIVANLLTARYVLGDDILSYLETSVNSLLSSGLISILAREEKNRWLPPDLTKAAITALCKSATGDEKEKRNEARLQERLSCILDDFNQHPMIRCSRGKQYYRDELRLVDRKRV